MMRQLVFAVALAPVPVAASPADMINELCGSTAASSEVRSGKKSIPPERLVAAAAAALDSQLRLDLFDANGDGTITRHERISAIRDPSRHCSEAGSPCRQGEHDLLLTIARKIVDIAYNGAIEQKPNHPSSVTPQALLPLETDEGTQPPTVALYCRPNPVTAGQQAEQESPAAGSRLRVSVAATPKDVLHLNLGDPRNFNPPQVGSGPLQRQEARINANAATTKAASVALTRDSAGGVTTINVATAVGLPQSIAPNTLLMPFVEFLAQSSRVDATVRKAKEEAGEKVDKDSRIVRLTPGLGLSHTARFGTFDTIMGFVLDLEDHARLARMELGYAPTLNLPPLGIARAIGSRLGQSPDDRFCFVAFVQPRAVAIGTAVLDGGRNTELASGGDIARIGVEARASLENRCGPLKAMGVTVAYRHLFRLTGPGPENFGLLNSTLAVPINDSDFRLLLSYRRGTDAESLRPIDILEAGIGLKF